MYVVDDWWSLPLLIVRFVHNAHMNDLWAMMKPTFDYLVKNPPSDKRLCPCVKDHNNNGVMDQIKIVAQKYPINGEVEPQVLNPKSIQEFWTRDQAIILNRKWFQAFYDDKFKNDTYSAAMFLYCKLKE